MLLLLFIFYFVRNKLLQNDKSLQLSALASIGNSALLSLLSPPLPMNPYIASIDKMTVLKFLVTLREA